MFGAVTGAGLPPALLLPARRSFPLLDRPNMITLLAVVIDGLSYASWLFLVGVGMTLAFGVMKILNVAHGSFFTFGAYVAATLVGAWFPAGYAPMASLLLLPVAAVAAALVGGYGLERGLMRHLYGKDEVVIALVTYATFLILEDVVPLVWGVDALAAYQPYSLLGNSVVAGFAMNNYDLALIALAAAAALATWFVLNRTAFGLTVRAVMHDREGAEASGVNVGRVYLYSFVASAFLGTLAGAATAPMISVAPGIGVEVVVISFAVVVIGGLGSVPGALVGAIIVGLCRSLAVHFAPYLELFAIYGVMTAVLAVKPDGLFAASQARRI